MGMKKHGSKKEALPLENNKKEPQRLTWKSKYEQICASHVTNGTEESEAKDEDETKTNALDGLSGYLSSDSSSGESELNEEVQNFLKEVDALYEEDRKQAVSNSVPSQIENLDTPMVTVAPPPTEMTMQYDHSKAPTVAWQECYDSTTGYTYYWNMETNEVTWDMPADYQTYMEALKQWQQYQAQGVAALLQARVQQQLQQQQQLLAKQAQEQAVSKAEAKLNSALKIKKKSLEKQSDSDEEKIELITSYGPFSEEESSDTDQISSKTPKVKKKKTDSKTSSPKRSMGPQLPPGGNKINKTMAKVIEKTKAIEKCRAAEKPKVLLTNSLVPYHPEFDDSDNEDPFENSKLNLVPDNGPPGAEVEKSSPALSPKEEIKKSDLEKVDGKEEEDDENVLLDRLKSQTQVLKELGGEIPEEVKSIIIETSEKDEGKADEQKCRSPLLEESKNLKLKLSARAKKLISASNTTAKARATDFIQAAEGLKPIPKKKEVDDDNLKNGSDGGEKRKLWLGMPTSLLSNDSNKSGDVRVREEGNRGGFGFVPSCDGKKRLKTDRIAFVKADVLHLSEEDNKGSIEEADEEPLEEQMDIKDVSGVLLDKMMFLSESKEPVPPVQIWTIQLETLLSAWESKNLRRNFLEDWLSKTSKELESLESSVAPDGWVCEWQREEKRYRYRKTLTGETSWEFPAAATGGGEEEMDLSTTPPPAPNTPPPPNISIPSPPSPPLITDNQPQPGEIPPLPAEIPPLPPLPPPVPPSPPPPPPQSPPPVHPSQPLPPGVDPPDLPPLPPPNPDYPPTPAPLHPVYQPQFYQPFPLPQPQPQLPPPSVSDPTPPPSSAHDLSSELDSFYSDLATLEPELPPPPPPADPPLPALSVVDKEVEKDRDADKDKGKKKKKTKLAPGLSLKKKGVSSLVAKWQQVQEDVRRDMKHD